MKIDRRLVIGFWLGAIVLVICICLSPQRAIAQQVEPTPPLISTVSVTLSRTPLPQPTLTPTGTSTATPTVDPEVAPIFATLDALRPTIVALTIPEPNPGSRLAIYPDALAMDITLRVRSGISETRLVMLRTTTQITNLQVIMPDLVRPDNRGVLSFDKISMGQGIVSKPSPTGTNIPPETTASPLATNSTNAGLLLDATAYATSTTTSLDRTEAQPVMIGDSIAENGIKLIPLSINLDDVRSGQYDGRILFSYDGGEAFLPVQVRVKDHPLWPLLVVSCAVIIGRMITWYLSTGRQYDEIKLRLSRLRQNIQHLHPEFLDPQRTPAPGVLVMRTALFNAQQAIDRSQAKEAERYVSEAEAKFDELRTNTSPPTTSASSGATQLGRGGKLRDWFGPRGRMAGVSWLLFAVVSAVLALTGFVQLYGNNPIFGANRWVDYLALLIWGLGAEAVRGAIGTIGAWDVARRNS